MCVQYFPWTQRYWNEIWCACSGHNSPFQVQTPIWGVGEKCQTYNTRQGGGIWSVDSSLAVFGIAPYFMLSVCERSTTLDCSSHSVNWSNHNSPFSTSQNWMLHNSYENTSLRFFFPVDKTGAVVLAVKLHSSCEQQFAETRAESENQLVVYAAQHCLSTLVVSRRKFP